MQREQIDSAAAEMLLRRQDALQSEASDLIAELDLLTTLSHAGKPEHIGSSVSGLMVWRDIDFNVWCGNRSLQTIVETMQPLLTHPRVRCLLYTNETGEHAPAELKGDERYYFVTHLESVAGHEWKIDISFWLSDQPRGHLAYLEYLRRSLSDETRLAILWIKDVWHGLPCYPYQVGGIDIYDAVLEHGVRTPAEFKQYLHEKGLPELR